MSSSSPRSIRFDEHVGGRLTAYVARHPGSSGSSAANRFVDDADLIGRPDAELLGHAHGRERILVTANIGDFATIAAQWRVTGRRHAGLVHLAHRRFPQDRSFVGAILAALTALHACGGLPVADGEVYLTRSDSWVLPAHCPPDR